MRLDETHPLVYSYVCRRAVHFEIFTKNEVRNGVEKCTILRFSRRGSRILLSIYRPKDAPHQDASNEVQFERSSISRMNGNRLWNNREIFSFLRLSPHFTFLIVTRERSVEIDRFFFQNVRLIEAHLLVWLSMGVWCSPSELRVKNCRKSDKSANPNFSKCNPNLVWGLGDASHREESENAHFDGFWRSGDEIIAKIHEKCGKMLFSLYSLQVSAYSGHVSGTKRCVLSRGIRKWLLWCGFNAQGNNY